MIFTEVLLVAHCTLCYCLVRDSELVRKLLLYHAVRRVAANDIGINIRLLDLSVIFFVTTFDRSFRL